MKYRLIINLLIAGVWMELDGWYPRYYITMDECEMRRRKVDEYLEQFETKYKTDCRKLD